MLFGIPWSIIYLARMNYDLEEAMEEDSDSEQPADSAAAAAVKAAGSAPVLSGEDPNPVLFLEGLPAEVTDDMMAVLFQQYVTARKFVLPRSTIQGKAMN